MIPAGTFTSVPVYAEFLAPYSNAYTPLSQTVPGGNAIGDPSQGRQVKNWTVSYSSGFIRVTPAGGSEAFSLAATDVQHVSLAFDNNMGLVIAWTSLNGDGNLYYYDTLSAAYAIRIFPGITSCRVCVDDARDVYTTESDVIFAYTKNNTLYYRQQRDRYDVEYEIGATFKMLKRMGPSTGGRFQIELL